MDELPTIIERFHDEGVAGGSIIEFLTTNNGG